MRLTKILFLCSLLALLVVPSALAIRFTDESYNTPTGVVGSPYSHQFNGASGCGPALPYQYRILGGSLPPGLSLSKSGLISGTPTQAGGWSFWVELSDEDPPSASWCIPAKSEREFTITVIGGLSIQQSSLSPKAATILNEPYSFQLTASASGTWSIQSGNLPAGITLGSNGLLSGTPTVGGDFTFVVKVSDGSRSATKTYTLTVVPRLKITSPTAPAAEIGLPFMLELKATGGRAPYRWSLAGGALPSGCTLDPSTGVISGVPGVATSGVVKLSVTDALGFTDSVDVSLPVAAKLAITKRLLPAAKVGRKYRARFTGSGGVAPRKWRIVGGRLPVGIKLNAKTGELSGTPAKAGTYRLRLQVTDQLGAVSSAGFVLKVVG